MVVSSRVGGLWLVVVGSGRGGGLWWVVVGKGRVGWEVMGSDGLWWVVVVVVGDHGLLCVRVG